MQTVLDTTARQMKRLRLRKMVATAIDADGNLPVGKWELAGPDGARYNVDCLGTGIAFVEKVAR